MRFFSIRFIGVATSCLLISLFGWTCSATAQSEQGDWQFNPVTAQQWLPLRSDPSNGIVIDIKVNGIPLRAMLDTGNSGNPVLEIASTTAERLNLAPAGKQVIGGYAGIRSTDTAGIASLTIGGFSHGAMTVRISPEIYSDAGYDAIVGLELLRLTALQVDWSSRRVRLLMGGELRRADLRPVGVATTVTARGYLTAPVDICTVIRNLIIDTGDNGDLTVPPSTVSRLGNCRSPVTSTRRASTSTGPIIKQVYAISNIKLGVMPVVGVLADAPPESIFSILGSDGAIGLDVLRRSNFVLDVTAGFLAFYAPIRIPRYDDRPTSGIQFRQLPDLLEVTHVMANSPAQVAGLHAGNRICSLNGHSIAELRGRLDAIKPVPGATIQLGICDGRTISMIAADFLAPPPSHLPVPVLPAFPADLGWLTEAMIVCGRASGAEKATACSKVTEAMNR